MQRRLMTYNNRANSREQASTDDGADKMFIIAQLTATFNVINKRSLLQEKEELFPNRVNGL